MVAFQNKGAMAATIVVAASDSLNKAAANYVCDGVADDVEIQAAIDALPAGGGRVVLLEGTYNIAVYISIKSNTEIDLAHGAKLKSINALDSAIFINSDFIGGNTHIYLHGGEIDGNRAGQTSDIEGIIHFDKVTNTIIEGMYIHDVYGDAIRVWPGGIAGSATDIGIIKIINNNIVTCKKGANNFGKAIGVATGRDIVIYGNHSEDTDHQGIWVGDCSDVSYNI